MHKTPNTLAGFDVEIQSVRDLIRREQNKLSDKLAIEELIKLSDSITKNTLALCRLYKLRADLANEEDNPAALLRQSLLELEEEWPEFKALVAKYPSGGKTKLQVNGAAPVTGAKPTQEVEAGA